VIGPTGADRLARAVGAPIEEELDGSHSLAFPTPGAPAYVPFSTAPVTVSRAVMIDEIDVDTPPPSPSTDASSTAPSDTTARPAQAQPAGAPAVDMDELADNVIDKLRRELLIERELGGGAMDLI